MITSWINLVWNKTRIKTVFVTLPSIVVSLISLFGMTFLLYPSTTLSIEPNITHMPCDTIFDILKESLYGDDLSIYLLNIACAVLNFIFIIGALISSIAFNRIYSRQSLNAEVSDFSKPVTDQTHIIYARIISFLGNVFFMIMHACHQRDPKRYFLFFIDSCFVMQSLSYLVQILAATRLLPQNKGGLLAVVLCEALFDIFSCMSLLIFFLTYFAITVARLVPCNSLLNRFYPEVIKIVYLVFRLSTNVIDFDDLTMSRLALLHFAIFTVLSLLLVNFTIAKMTTRLGEIASMKKIIHCLLRLHYSLKSGSFSWYLSHAISAATSQPKHEVLFIDVWAERIPVRRENRTRSGKRRNKTSMSRIEQRLSSQSHTENGIDIAHNNSRSTLELM